jgi:hypothetical protein
MLSVDTILSGFRFMVKQLDAAERKQMELVDSYQETITKLSAAKKDALVEAQRARNAAEKIQALLA